MTFRSKLVSFGNFFVRPPLLERNYCTCFCPRHQSRHTDCGFRWGKQKPFSPPSRNFLTIETSWSSSEICRLPSGFFNAAKAPFTYSLTIFCNDTTAVSWLRLLVAGLSQRSLEFDPGSFRLRICCGKIGTSKGFVPRICVFPSPCHYTGAP